MAASLGNAVGAVGGISKYYEGRRMQKEAQKFIDSFEWQELKNSFEGVSPSTAGADFQREEMARMTSSSVDALQQGGTRALVGGLGRTEAQNTAMSRQIGVDLDQQQQQIDFARAQEEANIRAMTEQRQANELAGYGQMLSTGMNMKYGGYADMMNAGQAQGQTNMAIMNSIMGGMTGGGMGGGGSQQSPVTSQYGGGMGSNFMGGGMGGFQQGFNQGFYK